MGTAESVVDFGGVSQWIFSGMLRWMFTRSVAFSKGLTFPVDVHWNSVACSNGFSCVLAVLLFTCYILGTPSAGTPLIKKQ